MGAQQPRWQLKNLDLRLLWLGVALVGSIGVGGSLIGEHVGSIVGANKIGTAGEWFAGAAAFAALVSFAHELAADRSERDDERRRGEAALLTDVLVELGPWKPVSGAHAPDELVRALRRSKARPLLDVSEFLVEEQWTIRPLEGELRQRRLPAWPDGWTMNAPWDDLEPMLAMKSAIVDYVERAQKSVRAGEALIARDPVIDLAVRRIRSWRERCVVGPQIADLLENSPEGLNAYYGEVADFLDMIEPHLNGQHLVESARRLLHQTTKARGDEIETVDTELRSLLWSIVEEVEFGAPPPHLQAG